MRYITSSLRVKRLSPTFLVGRLTFTDRSYCLGYSRVVHWASVPAGSNSDYVDGSGHDDVSWTSWDRTWGSCLPTRDSLPRSYICVFTVKVQQFNALVIVTSIAEREA